MSGGLCPHSKYFLPDGRREAIKFTHSGYSAGQKQFTFPQELLFYASVPHTHSTQLACLLGTERFNGQSSFQTSQGTDFTEFQHSEVKVKRQELRKTRTKVRFHNTDDPKRSFQQSFELASV